MPLNKETNLYSMHKRRERIERIRRCKFVVINGTYLREGEKENVCVCVCVCPEKFFEIE